MSLYDDKRAAQIWEIFEAICDSPEFARLTNGRAILQELVVAALRDGSAVDGKSLAEKIYGGAHGDEHDYTSLRARMGPLRTALQKFNERVSPAIQLHILPNKYRVTFGKPTSETKGPTNDPSPASIEAEWNNYELHRRWLRQIKRGSELRILTMMFIDSAEMEDTIAQLVREGVKIKVLLMNPKNESLIRACCRIRKDVWTPQKTQKDLVTQIEHWRNAGVEIKESDVMPCGFFVQAGRPEETPTRRQPRGRNKGAVPPIPDGKMLLGVLPAQGSYQKGPMIWVKPGTPLWTLLDENWRACWSDPLDPELRAPNHLLTVTSAHRAASAKKAITKRGRK